MTATATIQIGTTFTARSLTGRRVNTYKVRAILTNGVIDAYNVQNGKERHFTPNEITAA